MRLLIVGYGVAFIACFFNALALSIKLSLASVVLLNSIWSFKKWEREDWELDYDKENGWQLIEASRLTSIEILPSTVVSRYFVFLHYRSENQNVYQLIFKDSLVQNINDFRQLIVMLKIS